MRTRMCGPEGTFPPGHIIDLPESTAENLVRSGQAELVDPPELPVSLPYMQTDDVKAASPIEVTVTPEPPERAARTGRGWRRRKK